MISIFGNTGFIGGNYCNMFPNNIIKIGRFNRTPLSNDILYFISTTDNYNVFTDLQIDINTNLKILCEVLDKCTQHTTFNFISSWFVYGNTYLPAKETDPCNPKGFYSITKKCAEDLLISFCKTRKINYRILRLCNVYGIGDDKRSKKKNAIQYMIDLLRENKDVSLYDHGEHLRDLLHVNDICEAINLVINKGNLNEIYNIGSGIPTPIHDIIYMAKKYLNSTSNILSKETPEFHKIVQARNFWMNIDKIKALGFKPAISLEEGIKSLCQ